MKISLLSEFYPVYSDWFSTRDMATHVFVMATVIASLGQWPRDEVTELTGLEPVTCPFNPCSSVHSACQWLNKELLNPCHWARNCISSEAIKMNEIWTMPWRVAGTLHTGVPECRVIGQPGTPDSVEEQCSVLEFGSEKGSSPSRLRSQGNCGSQKQFAGCPWWSSDYDCMLPVQEAWVSAYLGN